jgi:hypothetical protein
MTAHKSNRRRLVGYALLAVLAVLLFRTPAVQRIVADALIEFIETTEKTLHLPCTLLNHDHCFSMDRLDPTCPQCF